MEPNAIQAPAWLRTNAVYQINPRTFSKEGTLASIRAELPNIRDLGFRIVYLCPIFEADNAEDRTYWSPRQIMYETNNPKNPYRMNDYFKIDEEYGTMADLEALVSDAHSLGMRVLLDLVYLHIGPMAPIIKRHPEFAQHNPDGTIRMTEWKFPYLNFENEGLCEYLWSNMVYYIGALDVDGFRCDVGDNVPDDFWMEGKRRIRAVKEDAILINEGSNYSRLATAFDSCYHFPWHGILHGIFENDGECTVALLLEREKAIMEALPTGGLLLRDMDNHDTVTDWSLRPECLIGHDGMEMIQVLNYALPGIPMVYSGNELADTANLNMFANRFYPGKYEVTDRPALSATAAGQHRMELMKALNTLLAENPVITGCQVEWLDNSAPDAVLSFIRPDEAHPLLYIGSLFAEDHAVTVSGMDLSAYHILLSNNAELDGDTVRLGAYGYVLMEK